MLPHYFQSHDKDIVDMDTKERIRYMSESSMSGTSGYSTTTSPDPRNSPSSSGYSPAHSPASVLQQEFSNLALPNSYQLSSPPQMPTPQQQQQQPTHSPQYLELQNVSINQAGYNNNNNNNSNTMAVNYSFASLGAAAPINFHQQTTLTAGATASSSSSYTPQKRVYPATLSILEQPVEKFRFRYKSEMHGTHGSLNGANSQRNTKSFPEIELCGYNGPAIIRCSLFQANRDSPHSHQLVVRKDDLDICDPHELNVSPDSGFYVEFKNMGIIHTAKKFIVEELLKKKRKRLQFELGRDNLTTKEQQELAIQTEKEAKDMNLNQVRLCFEAYRVDSNNMYTPIAEPVYSNTINNRKSAQTGELKITRLSIATGSVTGGEDLILLVEKVNKKNIKVRFFEMNEDDLVWEAFATFRESDVHHQYAIVCRTPAYMNKDIDKPVEVFIQLVRPSDDERSEPPVMFRYKPRDAVTSRKRRRTCSSISGGSSSGGSTSNSGSLSSGEIPRTIQEQQQQQQPGQAQCSGSLSKFLSEEIDRLMKNEEMRRKYKDLSNEDFGYSDELINILNIQDDLMNVGDSFAPSIPVGGGGTTEKDGAATNTTENSRSLLHYKKLMISKKQMDNARQQKQQQQQQHPQQHDEDQLKLTASSQLSSTCNSYMLQIRKIFIIANSKGASLTPAERRQAADDITKLYTDFSDLNTGGESLIHEMVINDISKYAIYLCQILQYFQLHNLLNAIVNNKNQTALHTACLYNRPHYIRPLLSLGCNPNVQDKQGDTAMHIAVREKHISCLDAFLKSNKELKLNLRNDDGFTPLHLTVRDNNYDMAVKLIQHDDSLMLIPNSRDGNNALHIVIQQQNLELVKFMMEIHGLRDSLLHTCNTAGHTPVEVARQLAASSKQAGEILSLLQSHCQTTIKSSNSTAATATTVAIPFSDMEDSCSNLVIKEEEASSRSSTDDDEEDGGGESTCNSNIEAPAATPMVVLPPQQHHQQKLTIRKDCIVTNDDDECAMDVQIKSEPHDDFYLTTDELKHALEDPNKFAQLANALNANTVWQHKLHIIPQLFLKKADMMLNYVKRNTESINVQLFGQTLQEIDANLIHLIKK
ncbi:nuclear factor NF-kappa-B family member relish [Musca autumnalis]|uniref:nuclear factor NF-kappa-B family member relish n=1 Tax=Musca autumnalis TaxID=221902 RepID=UPI003CE6D851